MIFGGFVLVGDGLVKHVGVFCPNYFSENYHMGVKTCKKKERKNNCFSYIFPIAPLKGYI